MAFLQFQLKEGNHVKRGVALNDLRSIKLRRILLDEDDSRPELHSEEITYSLGELVA
jgi:hypothetical protein